MGIGCAALANRACRFSGETMTDADLPGVLAPPPMIFFGLEAGAFAVNWLAPAPLLPGGPIWWAGLPLLGLGISLGASAIAAMRRSGTPVDPYEPSAAVVTGGPYRYTRNPIYLGLVLIYLGVAALLNSIWPLVMLPVVLVLIDRFVIAREERYLERKFGGDYLHYKSSVRRWL